MYRILAVSDTHGRLAPLELLAEKVKDVDLLVHLGDGIAQLNEIKKFYPSLETVCVRGNNDFTCDAPDEQVLCVKGKRVFLCHGHTLSVKSGIGALLSEGKRNRADLILFGHTHDPFYTVEDGVTIVNPGALGMGFPPSYAVIDLVDNVFVVNLKTLQ